MWWFPKQFHFSSVLFGFCALGKRGEEGVRLPMQFDTPSVTGAFLKKDRQKRKPCSVKFLIAAILRRRKLCQKNYYGESFKKTSVFFLLLFLREKSMNGSYFLHLHGKLTDRSNGSSITLDMMRRETRKI